MTKLCARGKSAAKRKFTVYPSAYANAYASKICAGKIKDPSGKKRKDWGPKKAKTGMAVSAGSQSGLGRLQKSGLKFNTGGYFDEGKTMVKQKTKTGPVKGGHTPEIPPQEFMKYKKFKKNKVVSAYTGKAIRQPSETNKEFEMRHEYHTPFGKPQKARGGGVAIRGTNFKGVL